ncbi:MAG: hypothetical protein K940chlam9_00032 [Chlamydiae bacterium]|nr:hypothetical protein [Chlamydiota bacterium]
MRELFVKKNGLWVLLALLAVKGLLLLWLVVASPLGLSPDEAQYWTWSQSLDWGYYSKPPGIAWQIALTSGVLGSTSLGVRAGALIIGFLLPLVVFGIARGARMGGQIPFWAGVVMAFSPIGVYLTFAATTDGGAILFLTCAVLLVVKGVEREEGPSFGWVGLMILLGALYKWTAYIFWPLLLPFLFFVPKLRKKMLLWGILLSLLALVPTVYWNASHEWATFKHVGGAIGEKKGGNFFDFLGAQIGLLSPVYFFYLVLGCFFSYREKRKSFWFQAAFPTLVLLYLGGAFFKKMQPNWAAYLYPPGLALVGWFALEKGKRGSLWLTLGTVVSIGIVAFGLLVPLFQKNDLFSIPYKLNPFRQTLGWENLQKGLSEAGYNPETDFLFGDKYQTASLLSFYSPQQKRAYYFNISQSRKTQFSYWPQMEQEEVGKDGYFVVLENTTQEKLPRYENRYLKALTPYFEKVSFVEAFPLFTANDTPVKYALIFYAQNYSGKAPTTPKKY